MMDENHNIQQSSRFLQKIVLKVFAGKEYLAT
jgi:hypothetical protein